MLGLLYTLFAATGSAIYKSKVRSDDSSYNLKNRKEAQLKGEPLYFGFMNGYGSKFMTKTGNWCKEFTRNGDEYYQDSKTGEVINWSEYLRKKKDEEMRQEALRKGKTVYIYEYKNEKYEDFNMQCQNIYIDLKTNKVLKKHHFTVANGIPGEGKKQTVFVYIDPDNNKILRPDDDYKDKDHWMYRWYNYNAVKKMIPDLQDAYNKYLQIVKKMDKNPIGEIAKKYNNNKALVHYECFKDIKFADYLEVEE